MKSVNAEIPYGDRCACAKDVVGLSRLLIFYKLSMPCYTRSESCVCVTALTCVHFAYPLALPSRDISE